MKKIMFLSLMGIVFTGSAFAGPSNCLPKNCNRNGTGCLGSTTFKIDPGKDDPDYPRSYICRSDECGAGAVVFAPDLTSAFICRMKSDSRISGKWIDYKPTISNCSEEHMRMLRNRDVHGKWLLKDPVTDPHAKKTIVNSTWVDEHTRRDSDMALVFGSDNVCYAWTCEYGFVPDASGLNCVEGAGPEEDGTISPVPGGDCNKAGYEIATENIILTTICPECSRIVKGQCYESDMLRCYEAIKSGQPANWNGEKCNCGDKQKWNSKSNKCEAPKGQSCEELYKGFTERIACCNAGRYTIWMGAKDNGTCICVNPTTKVQDPALEWFYDATTKKGFCKAKGGNEQPVIPVTPEPEKDCWYTFYGEFKCGNGTRVKKNYQIKLSKDDLKGLTCESFQEKYRNDARGVEDLFKKLCLDPNYVENQPLDAATKKAINNINSFFGISESNRNVWRDEDGQFNTTRLASDATAGVVLGTVGGIVSAKVIKKKQLEKGFDVLHCTVGGQRMADYGDTFQVSYQR